MIKICKKSECSAHQELNGAIYDTQDIRVLLCRCKNVGKLEMGSLVTRCVGVISHEFTVAFRVGCNSEVRWC